MRKAFGQGYGRLKARLQSERGIGLVESIVAVAVAGTAVVGYVIALSTGSIAVREQETAVTAQGLVQSQLEYTKSEVYDADAGTYPAVAAPEGYSLSVTVGPVPGADSDIQMVTVTVSREGQDLLTMADYKVNR